MLGASIAGSSIALLLGASNFITISQGHILFFGTLIFIGLEIGSFVGTRLLKKVLS